MSIKAIDAKTLKQWIEAKEVILVDVRNESEYQDNHIKGSINLPLDKVNRDSLPKVAKGKKLVFQCELGGRSMQACEQVQQFGGKNTIYNLTGGITAWKEAKFSIEGNMATSKAKVKAKAGKSTQAAPKKDDSSCSTQECSTSSACCMSSNFHAYTAGLIALCILLGYYTEHGFFYLVSFLLACWHVIVSMGKCVVVNYMKKNCWNKK
ncbi:MAG: rhodanese-like domain-containing protein [Alphaproteobacteria bacterium]|jgi:rhodanese-related sulfurtransferase|nr:rhodanese-like domain-containing protein [Candidatus Jidaibacter sp.]